MYYISVLRSLKNTKHYIGHTSKNIFQRLSEHNRNCNQWTKQNGPFRMIHSEKYETKKESISRERFLKSGQGRKWLDDNIKD